MALKTGFKQLLAAANVQIETVSVRDALAPIDDPGTVFVDIRHSGERDRNGAVAAAVYAPRGFLEFVAGGAVE